LLGLYPERQGAKLRQKLGVQLQDSQAQEKLTVAEILRLYASFYEDPAEPDELIELLGLQSHREVFFAKLSGGLKQRLSVALALVGRPEVAILDELTTGLDPHARRETWGVIERVRDTGVAIVLVSHFMEEVERLCDRVMILDRGRKVALDTPAGLVDQATTHQRMSFIPSEPLDDRMLLDLDEVERVEREGPRLIVVGTDELVHAVTSTLARERVVARELRIDQHTLDDAFIALTGRPLDSGETGNDEEVGR
jgi:ABC-2 type transport system ATP-binding protein